MKWIILALLGLAALNPSSSYIERGDTHIFGSGVVSEETRSVAGIRSISCTTAGHLYVTQGETESLTIEAEDNIIPLVTTTVHRGELRIAFESNASVGLRRPLNVYVTVNDLNRVELSDAWDAELPDLHTARFELVLNGASSASLNIDAEDLTVRVGGASHVTAVGRTVTQHVTLSGASSYRAAELLSDRCEIEVSGTSRAEVHAAQHLDATASGMGAISFAGAPGEVNIRMSGQGRVEPVDD